MSLRRNILSNYASQFYVTLVGIIMLPFYIRYMGAEAYGLVGFFSMLQVCFNLLDMGLTATIARESARFNGGAMSAQAYRRLARALEGVFVFIAILGCFLLFTLAEPLARYWLNSKQLPMAEVTNSIQLIAFIVAMRWMGGLYRGIISGAERMVWLSGFNSVIATLRFVMVLPVLIYVSASPQMFFSYQLIVALFELLILAAMAYRLLPTLSLVGRVRWEWAPLKPMLKFSLSIAFTSAVWVLVTQTDKLVLSKILPLADYGYFTVAVLVANGIMIISGPISSALMPRMARLQAEGYHERLIMVYRQATQLVTIIAIPAALMLVCFASEVLWAWTGDRELVNKTASVLSLYAIGYAFLVVGAFPYYLQYAKGDLKLHLSGNVLFVVLLIPSLILAAYHYGMEGAGWAWLIANALYFIFWTPLVHRRFAPGLHASWLWADILRPAILPIVVAVIAAQWLPWSQQRPLMVMQLIVIGLLLLGLAYLLASRIKIRYQGTHCEQ